MIVSVAKKLRLPPEEIKIYNLCHPSKGRGMLLSIAELRQVEATIHRIKEIIEKHHSVRRIVVGGVSGPMPVVALLIKFIVPRIRIEVRTHHKARPKDGGPLKFVRAIRR